MPVAPNEDSPSPPSGGGSGGSGGGDGGGGGGGPLSSASGAYAAGQGAIYDQVAVTSDGTNGKNAPSYPLQPSMTLEVSPIGGNAATAFLAKSEPASRTGPRTAFTVGSTPRVVDARNLAEFWVFGAAGEGLLFTVRQSLR